MYSGLALLMDIHYPISSNGIGLIHVSGSGFNRPLSLNAKQLNHQGHVKIECEKLLENGYKTGGRQTGTPNKRTAITENIEQLILQEFEKIPAYIKSLNNKERLEFIIKLLPYAVQKYTNKTISDETPMLPIFEQIQIVTSVDEKERLEKVEAYEKRT